jgi:hypothetical protein
MLASKVPNCRISVFHYASQWFGKGSVDTRIDVVADQLLYALDRSRGVRIPPGLLCTMLIFEEQHQNVNYFHLPLLGGYHSSESSRNRSFATK